MTFARTTLPLLATQRRPYSPTGKSLGGDQLIYDSPMRVTAIASHGDGVLVASDQRSDSHQIVLKNGARVHGNDVVNGGSGRDTVSYRYSPNGMVVDLNHNQANGEGVDTLVNLENVTGSEHGDEITGNSGANVIWGLGGNDSIHGYDGDDRLYGGGGHDSLNGGRGHDLLFGDDGNDRLSHTSQWAKRLRACDTRCPAHPRRRAKDDGAQSSLNSSSIETANVRRVRCSLRPLGLTS